MRELNYESVRDIASILVIKKDWTVQLGSDSSPGSDASIFGIGVKDNRFSAGSKTGAIAIVLLLTRIIGKKFVSVDCFDDRIVYLREDSYIRRFAQGAVDVKFD